MYLNISSCIDTWIDRKYIFRLKYCNTVFGSIRNFKRLKLLSFRYFLKWNSFLLFVALKCAKRRPLFTTNCDIFFLPWHSIKIAIFTRSFSLSLSLSLSLFSKIDFGAINGFQFVAAFKWRKISEIKKPWSPSVEGSVVPLPIQLSKSSSIEVFGWGEVAGKESWLQDTFIHSKQYQHQLPISLNRFTKWFSAF